MPRKTKETIEDEIKINKDKNTSKVKKVANKDTKKTTSSTTKKIASIKKETTTKKKNTTKPKKVTTTKTKNITKKKIEVVEYYDLPYSYNQTVVKILAQTPTNLFVYWDISKEDYKKYQEQFGENFFQITIPVLIVYNDSMHYQYEIEINDFANSWYLQVNDSFCNYHVELGRRIKSNDFDNELKIKDNYIAISDSNKIESPNDKILLDTFKQYLTFRNVKSKEEVIKTFSDITYQKSKEDIYHFYQNLYQEDFIEKLYTASNPSSNSFS